MKDFVATIGMFDGVHLGHQFVLSKVVEEARQQDLYSMCITFSHSPKHEQILTPLDRKVELIQALGIERVMVLPFTEDLKRLTAREFMKQWLCEERVKVLLTGYDNRFGHNREEGFDDYACYGRELGIEVKALPAAGSVSSSNIRQLLCNGQVAEAAQSLGRPYSIGGTVVHGEHLGTLLGFPTANIKIDHPNQLIPAAGAYAVRVYRGERREERGEYAYGGMMNIGHRPTFGQHAQTLEVHLFDYAGDLYDRPLTIEFVQRLRDERQFASADALAEQLKQDAVKAKQAL